VKKTIQIEEETLPLLERTLSVAITRHRETLKNYVDDSSTMTQNRRRAVMLLEDALEEVRRVK
jgi:hypothetical protein